MDKKSLTAKLTSLMMQENLTNEFKKIMQQVVRLRHKGKDDKALEILEKQYKKTPNDLRITAEYGDCLMATGDWETARKVLNPMTETKPPYLRGIHLFGRCLFHQGKFEEAHKVLEQVQLFNPNDADRLVDLGNALLQMDKVKDAIEHFDRAIEIDDTLTEAKVGKGQGLLMEGQVNDALAILKEVSSKREMASIFNLAAVMSMRQKRFDPGMKLYMAAIKVLGQDKTIHSRLMFNMGIGYRRWSKPDKALTCFDESLKLDPTYTKADAQKAIINGKEDQDGEIAPPNADEIVTIMEMNSNPKPKEDSGSLDFDVDFGQLGGDEEDDDDLDGMEEGISVDDDN
jgi:tetratricopeptide (TPR) repeat protein